MKTVDDNLMTAFSAALHCETTAEREAYLDKACVDSPALRGRVEALLLAHNRSIDFLRESPSDPAITAAFQSALLPGAANSSGRAFQEELRRLLRSRLILAYLLLVGFVVLLQLLSLTSPPGEGGLSHRPDNGVWWRFAIPFAVGLIGILALRRSDSMRRGRQG